MIKIIRSKVLEHKGGFYFYRLHEMKAGNLCGNEFSTLKKYLNEMFTKCPDHNFNGGPRSSALKWKLPFDIIEVQGHEVSALAKAGLEMNNDRYLNNHLKVQTFMLENDDSTISIEVPIWLEINYIGYEIFLLQCNHLFRFTRTYKI